MPRTVLIRFPQDQDVRYSLVSRLQNFGEDVFRHTKMEHWGAVSLDEVDCATSEFSVRDVKASKVRRLVAWLEQKAEKQHLIIEIEVR